MAHMWKITDKTVRNEYSVGCVIAACELHFEGEGVPTSEEYRQLQQHTREFQHELTGAFATITHQRYIPVERVAR